MKTQGLFRHFSVVTLIAFLLNAMLPIAVAYGMAPEILPNAVETTADEPDILLGEQILICTTDGLKLVSLSDELPAGKQNKSHRQYRCALCFLAAHSSPVAVPADSILIVYARTQGVFLGFSIAIVGADSLVIDHIQSRAPPLTA